MITYISVFLIAIFYVYFSKPKYRKAVWPLAVFMLFLALFIGLGDMIGGYDRYVYGSAFDAIADEVIADRSLKTMLYLINGSEYGYFVWEVILAHITANRYIFILITTIAIYILIFRAFYKYLESYPLGCIVFLGFLYYFTMTYLRQVIAVGIAWQGLKYIWERRPFHFFSVILFAYSFHNSVLILVPFYFIPIKKYSKKNIIKALFIALIIGLTPIPNILVSSVGDVTGMSERTAGYSTQDQGFRIEYIFEVLFIVWFLFYNYQKIWNTPKMLTMLNMSFAFCAILLIFMRFGQGGRFGWYFLIGVIYMFSTIPIIRHKVTWIKPLIVILCFLLFMRVTYAWRSLNQPYKTFLTNGEPCGDGSIYRLYEYNTEYTKDKFCR